MKNVLFSICIAFSILTVQGGQLRVIGGNDAAQESAPYSVSLQSLDGNHVCGGAIIGKRTIISAAHCFVGALPEYVIAVVGTSDLSKGGMKYKVSQLIPHPLYNATSKEHDLAIVVTSVEMLFFSRRVEPVLLINNVYRQLPEGTALKFTGFGVDGSGQSATKLQEIQLTVLEMDTCKYAYRNIRPLFDSQMCTFNKINEGVCHGDSGSPLVYNNILVGIASFGIPCAVGYPDVFTKATAYLPWIKQYACV